MGLRSCQTTIIDSFFIILRGLENSTQDFIYYNTKV